MEASKGGVAYPSIFHALPQSFPTADVGRAVETRRLALPYVL